MEAYAHFTPQALESLAQAARQRDVEIASLQSFRCPQCNEPVSDLRQGRELQIESIEIEDQVEEQV